MAPKLSALATQFPVIFLTGPRQSGKTTLARSAFPAFTYTSLEDLDQREYARTDPRGFLRRFEHAPGLILDEVQRSPDLFSYLQGMVDESPRRPVILTGSQQFTLSARISQTLAGRAAVLSLLPFSMAELCQRAPLDPAHFAGPTEEPPLPDWPRDQILYTGGYPPIYDRAIAPADWLNGYVRTYIERDVRDVLQVGDLETFERFVRLCAGRSAQSLNMSALASDCGITQPTARRWLSVLTASGILFLLRPHFNNLNKRLTKSPKLYFLDSGLMCYLLRLRSAADLEVHPLRGAIFETFVVSELYKAFAHRGEDPPLYFFRDQAGHEVDVLIDLGIRLVPVEIKAGETVQGDFFSSLDFYCKLSGQPGGVLVYGGAQAQTRGPHTVRPWFACS